MIKENNYVMRDAKNIITLPKPCDADWQQMTPTDRGRHCAQCCKTVVDFTLLSDGEILDVFKKAKDNPPCGHFLETQLNRELVDTRYRPSVFSMIMKRAAATLILFHSVTVAALAQQAKKAPVNQQAGKQKTTVKTSKLQICGRVLNYGSKEPIAGARVWINDTQIDSVTDKHGMFVLTLPDNFNMAHLLLLGSLPNYTGSDMIIEDTMSLADVVNNKELVLYAYKVQTLQQHDLITPDINVRTYGGIPVHYVEPIRKKPNIWQRMTRPLRGKKQS